MKSARRWISALIIVASANGLLLTMLAPQVVAAAPAATCNQGFLGFPAWYRGLTEDNGSGDPCAIMSPDGQGTHPTLTNFIWHIGLNVVEIAIVAAAYLSGFYFLYGGFLFIVSQGKPDNAAKARSTMLEALIGLIISLAAVTIINFIIDGLKIL